MDEPLFKITESKTAGAVRWSKRAIRAEARVVELEELVEEWQAGAEHTAKNLQIVGEEGDRTELLLIEQQDRVAALEKRNKELYKAMQIAEDVGVDEGLFDEDERMTERAEPPMTDAGIQSCEEFVSGRGGTVPDREESKPEAENQPGREDTPDV